MPDDMPPMVRKALEHVHSIFPDVWYVVYLNDGRWLYFTEDGTVPNFDGKVDISVLEDASDAVCNLPVVYSLL